MSAGFNEFSADRTGLEPATSAVTGQHSNQLNYRSWYLGLRFSRSGRFTGAPAPFFDRRRAKIMVLYSFYQNFPATVLSESIINQLNDCRN